MLKFPILASLLTLSTATLADTPPTCNPTTGPVSVAASTPQMVYAYQTDHCNLLDFADNPVRPFLVGNYHNHTVMWFASNSWGYFKSFENPESSGQLPDLSTLQREVVNGQCKRWLSSRFNSDPGQTPIIQYPITSYHNEIWMVEPYTTDGQHVYALVHNEYHNNQYDLSNVYGNLVGAVSNDGGDTFQYNADPATPTDNLPVFASPYVFPQFVPANPATADPGTPGSGKGGMFAQTNIIKWGAYYYILVDRALSTQGGPAPDGMCIYQSPDISNFSAWRGWDAATQTYDVPLVPAYPSSLTPPEQQQYLCSTVLPPDYRFSWSYNTILHKFVIIGIDPIYKAPTDPSQPGMSLVYTLASIDPSTNALVPELNPVTKLPVEYFLEKITFMAPGSANTPGLGYPSLLDPMSPHLAFTDPSIPNPPALDRNYQYSAAKPFLYYTQFNAGNNLDRDIVRVPLQVQNCVSS